MNPAVTHISTPIQRPRVEIDSAIRVGRVVEKRELAFGVATVVILLLLQTRWDAPLVLQAGGDANAMAQVVRDGDILHRILGVLLGVSGFFWCRFYTKDVLRWRHRPGWTLLAWILWLGSSLVWSEDPGLTARRLILLFFLLMSAAAFSRLTTEVIFALVSFGAVASLLIGIACELFWGTFQPLQPGFRFGGTGHPNLQGTTLAVGAIAALGLALSNRKHRRAAVIAAALCLSGLWLTNSRTAMISLLACIVLGAGLALMRNAARKGKLIQVVGMTLCAFAGAATMIVGSGGLRSAVASGITEQRDEGRLGDFTGRVDVWKTCIRYASEHPVVGYGYDTFWSATRISDISTDLQWPINEAHSMYLDLWLNQGLLGAVLFLTALIISLAKNVRSFWRGNNSGGIWAMLLFFPLVHGMTESIMVPMTNYPAYIAVAAIFVQMRNGHDTQCRSIT